MKMTFHYTQLVLCIAACTLTGCVTAPIAKPGVAAVSILPVQAGDTGFYLTDANRTYLVSNGVPPSFFTFTPRGWYISQQQEEQAADILLKERNP